MAIRTNACLKKCVLQIAEVDMMANTKEIIMHVAIILAVFTATFFLGGMV